MVLGCLGRVVGGCWYIYIYIYTCIYVYMYTYMLFVVWWGAFGHIWTLKVA